MSLGDERVCYRTACLVAGREFDNRLPSVLNCSYDFADTSPKRYPVLVDVGIVDAIVENMHGKPCRMTVSGRASLGGDESINY